jgi:hypothetical protein
VFEKFKEAVRLWNSILIKVNFSRRKLSGTRHQTAYQNGGREGTFIRRGKH